MTSRTPRRHRRLALMAAGTAAAMVLLPGAASAQGIYSVQQVAGAAGAPAVPSVPGDPNNPSNPSNPSNPTAPSVPPAGIGDLPGGLKLPGLGGDLPLPAGSPSTTGAPGGDDAKHDDSPNSKQIKDPKPPDHASGAVGDIELLRTHLLDITKYDATIEDNGSTHSDSTVLAVGGLQIGHSSASSDGQNRNGSNPTSFLCQATGGALCLGLLYNNVVATEDRNDSLAAARGGLLALCLLGHDKDATASYDCNGLLSLGVAEGLGVAERDKARGHTKAESANELVNLCIGKREKLNTPCQGLGLQVLHSDSESSSREPATSRHSWLLGIDSNGKSSYLLDQPTGLSLPEGCGDSAILCLLLNQGKSVIFHNPKGAGSAQEALRLELLNPLLLVVLGQSETLVHETAGNGGNGGDGNGGDGNCDGKDKDCHEGDHGKGENGSNEGNGGGLASTGADVTPLLAGGFLLVGAGALTVATTRRRAGKHSI